LHIADSFSGAPTGGFAVGHSFYGNFGAAFLIPHDPCFFTLRESNTFSPNSVGRRTLPPGTALPKVEKHQCLLGRERTGHTVFRGGENRSETRFLKNQNFGTS
jgi:hypothetical protein